MTLDLFEMLAEDRTPLFLAPQAGVSESPFRRLCRSFGADVVSTEFVSAAGIMHGNQRTRDHLRFHPDESPIGIQIFGADAAQMADAAALVTELFVPDFVDINFGCPVKKVVKRNGGSGCLRDLGLVREITRGVVEATHLPVTTKIRSGYNEQSRDPVAIGLACQEAGSRMVTLHPRTRADMYSGLSRWDEITAVVEALEIPVVGNGDIKCGADAIRMREETGCAGIMIARGSHGAPWIFRQARAALDGQSHDVGPTVEERFQICLAHARNSIAFELNATRAVQDFRKHLGWYTKGIPRGRELRAQLFQVTTLEELEARLQNYLEEHLAQEGIDRTIPLVRV